MPFVMLSLTLHLAGFGIAYGAAKFFAGGPGLFHVQLFKPGKPINPGDLPPNIRQLLAPKIRKFSESTFSKT